MRSHVSREAGCQPETAPRARLGPRGTRPQMHRSAAELRLHISYLRREYDIHDTSLAHVTGPCGWARLARRAARFPPLVQYRPRRGRAHRICEDFGAGVASVGRSHTDELAERRGTMRGSAWCVKGPSSGHARADVPARPERPIGPLRESTRALRTAILARRNTVVIPGDIGTQRALLPNAARNHGELQWSGHTDTPMCARGTKLQSVIGSRQRRPSSRASRGTAEPRATWYR